jgi:16S rRNA (uracil1498-N3)-methyltransferase
MNRFFVEKKNIGSGSIGIDRREDIHHIVKVLRVVRGEDLLITDGEGGSYVATLARIAARSLSLEIKEKRKVATRQEQGALISLACAIPKNAPFEDIIDKGTQLGVTEIIPLITQRTLVRKESFDKKEERRKRVMLSAAQQSGVLFLPELHPCVGFFEFLPRVTSWDLCLLPNLSKNSQTLKSAVAHFKGKKILVMIGPEGDFSPEEVDAALRAGCLGVTLGASVLRVDTAALSVVSFLKLIFDNEKP